MASRSIYARSLANARARLASCALFVSLIMASVAFAATEADVRDHAFLTVQRSAASVAAEALQKAALRQASGNEELSRLLRARQDLTDRRAAVQHELTASAQTKGAAAEAAVAAANTELTQLKARVDLLDTAIEAGFPAFRELVNPRPMSVQEVQETLSPGEVLILTFHTGAEMYLWAISGEKAMWHMADFEEGELAREVKLLRAMLDVTQNNRAATALDEEADVSASASQFDRALAFGLYTSLLAPLEPVLDGATHVISVVDGPLTSLPLGVLVASKPEGEDADPTALRQTDWLITRFALTVLPNVSSLRALRASVGKAEDGAARVPFAGFGDPIFQYQSDGAEPTGVKTRDEKYTTRGTFEAVKSVARLAPLPNTATELKRLARLTGTPEGDLYLGAAATEEAVKAADLSRVDVLAFATHGLLSGELSGLSEPALVFTPPHAPSVTDDALLTATEAAGLKLSAQLIILSACNTAGSDGTPGAEGLSGLARSFIYAGARSILVSHWPVDDHATSKLTTGMVAQMRAGQRRGEALRSAILQLMQSDPNPDYAHPRFWAPFILVGDG